jgi:hypothetical protein
MFTVKGMNAAIAREFIRLSAATAVSVSKRIMKALRFPWAASMPSSSPATKGSSHGAREQGKYANEFYTTVKTTYTIA